MQSKCGKLAEYSHIYTQNKFFATEILKAGKPILLKHFSSIAIKSKHDLHIIWIKNASMHSEVIWLAKVVLTFAAPKSVKIHGKLRGRASQFL